MLVETTRCREWRTPVAGFLTVQVANALGVWLRHWAGPPAVPIGVRLELLFSVGTVVEISLRVIWFTLLGVRLAFSRHSVED